MATKKDIKDTADHSLESNDSTQGNAQARKKSIVVTNYSEFDEKTEVGNDSEEVKSEDELIDDDVENSGDQDAKEPEDVSEQADETEIDGDVQEPVKVDETSRGKTIGDAIEETESGEPTEYGKSDNTTVINNQNTDELDDIVDDIVRTESTQQLAEADAKLATAADPKKRLNIAGKLKSASHKWWHTPWLRNTTLGTLILLIVAIVLVPATRYGVLNAFGVRVKSSMTVIDSQTRLPLKNIQVLLQDQSAQTDKQGQVYFDELKLGKSQLAITKRGYADNARDITLGWGSNPIGDQEIVATGEQFTFILVDWLSNDRITEAEATAGESSSNSDADGKIILTIDQESIGEDDVVISAEGYRDEVILSEDLNDADIEVIMVPDRRHAFVSNRDNKFDVYTVDLDGKNEKLILEATEKEREVPGIVPHHTKNTFALVSSRDGIENTDKYILDGLFIVDAETGDTESIGRSEKIQILGWSDDWLVYTQVIEGTSRGNAERSKLYSFNNETGEKIELAAANYFNDIELVNDTVTYAVSSFAIPQSRAKLYSIRVDGNENQELLNKQVYTIFRPTQTSLLFNAADQKWFSQTNDEDVEEVDPVLSPNSFKYVSSPDDSKVAWSETRDGKGVLFVSDSNGSNKKEIAVIAGLDSVEYWANDKTIIFRIIKTEETADYVLHIDKPDELRKISDVTASKRVFF